MAYRLLIPCIIHWASAQSIISLAWSVLFTNNNWLPGADRCGSSPGCRERSTDDPVGVVPVTGTGYATYKILQSQFTSVTKRTWKPRSLIDGSFAMMSQSSDTNNPVSSKGKCQFHNLLLALRADVLETHLVNQWTIIWREQRWYKFHNRHLWAL